MEKQNSGGGQSIIDLPYITSFFNKKLYWWQGSIWEEIRLSLESPEVIYMDVRKEEEIETYWYARFRIVENPWSIETGCPVKESSKITTSLYFDIQRGFWVAYNTNSPENWNYIRYITPDKDTTKQLSKDEYYENKNM